MGQPTVQNVSAQIVRALKQRAAGHGRSAEAEHRKSSTRRSSKEKRISPRAPKRCADGCAPPSTAARSSAPTGTVTKSHERLCGRRERGGKMARERGFLRRGGAPHRRQGDADRARAHLHRGG